MTIISESVLTVSPENKVIAGKQKGDAIAYRIDRFGAGNPADVDSIVAMHSELLSHSPVVLLGPRFMRDFYYTLLPREGLVCGAVAYVDGQPAGFIVATHDSSGFMTTAIRRHWLRLGWLLAKSVLLQPSRLGAILEARQIMKNLDPVVDEEPVGEMLSFGVMPDYRSLAFVRKSKIMIGKDLLNAAVGLLEEQQVSAIRSVVDEDNLEAKLFYHGAGWALERTVHGWSKPTVEFLWRA